MDTAHALQIADQVVLTITSWRVVLACQVLFRSKPNARLNKMAQSILCFGVTGSFKSSNAAEYVEWLYARYGGITRGLFGDNFGPLSRQVNDGLLDAWDLTGEPDPLGCILRASEGYWPEKLVNGRVVGDKLIKNNFNGVSGYLIEGFKENADLFMRMLEKKKWDTGEPLMGHHADMVYGVPVTYAMSSRGTYFFVQNQTHRYFKLGFKGLPVPWVMVTSHECVNAKKGVYGVAVAGTALARDVPQWFDHTLHFDKGLVEVSVRVGNKIEKIHRVGGRAFFDEHVRDNVKWQAKLGVDTYTKAGIYQKWPMGYIPLLMQEDGALTSSIRTLLEVIDPMPVVGVESNVVEIGAQ